MAIDRKSLKSRLLVGMRGLGRLGKTFSKRGRAGAGTEAPHPGARQHTRGGR